MTNSARDPSFQYPPELLNLLVETIPLLSRGKKDVLLFFYGAGVPKSRWVDLDKRLREQSGSVSKYAIARNILVRLNEAGDSGLRERREVLKRVVEFEDFSSCWPEDVLKAKGLVAEIRRVINVKDSFTRMSIERETEREARVGKQQKERKAAEERAAKLEQVRKNLVELITDADPHRRGIKLQSVVNDLFKTSGVLVREAFALRGDSGEGILEQLDGVIELDGELYLVEMKWWSGRLGVEQVSAHLVRVYHRGQSRGILISASGFTDPAIKTCKEALQKAVFVLATVEELILLLEHGDELSVLLKAKVRAAIVDKNPFYKSYSTVS